MALNGNNLGTAIKNAIKAWNSNPMTTPQENLLEDAWKVIANEITSHIQTYLDAAEVNFDNTLKNLLLGDDVQEAIDENSFGRSPIGSIIAWHKDFSGTPALPSNWVECNGQTIADAGSPYNGQVIPNLNGDSGGADLNDGVNDNLGKTGEVFLKGDITSGKTELDRFQGHWHEYWRYADEGGSGTVGDRVTASATSKDSTNSRIRTPISDGANGTPRVGADTKPRSFSVIYIMRIR